MRRTLALFAALALTASALGAQAAAPCHDAKGKFIKCPAPAAAAASPKSAMAAKSQCRDAKGHFTKCTGALAKK